MTTKNFTFTLKTLPTLDKIVLETLKMYAKNRPEPLALDRYKHPLLIGSGNAIKTLALIAEILGLDAVVATESNYMEKWQRNQQTLDGAYLLSASGGKHAPIIAKTIAERGLPVTLLTCNPAAAAKEYAEGCRVFPRLKEPYTYNTSTYLGMILAATGESAGRILEFIKRTISLDLRHKTELTRRRQFLFLLPDEFGALAGFYRTKFDELFGRKVAIGIFTFKEAKHAVNVVESEDELIVSFGMQGLSFPSRCQKLFLTLPHQIGGGKDGWAMMMALGYYFIGRIQANNPAWFKESLVQYCARASQTFNEDIRPIVEP